MSFLSRSSQRPTVQGQGSRILAYVADATSEAAIKRAVSNTLGGSADIRKGDVRTAVKDLGHERSPEILIVDLAGIELPISAMEDLAEVCEPSVQVLAIGDRNDVGLYRELKRIGVADYLFKPLTVDMVEKVLAPDGTGAGSVTQRTGKLVACIGARGGVGTTTIAVNLATFLSEENKRRVVLVDLDGHTGAVALHLNLQPNHALREALENPERVDDLFLERAMLQANDRLDVLASEEPLEEALNFRPDALKSVVAKLGARYHYIVADLPGAADPLSREVLTMASIRVLVTDASLAGARDVLRLRKFLTTADPGRHTFTVVNRMGSPGDLKPQDLAKALGGPPDITFQWRPKPLSAAHTLGVPAVRSLSAFRNEIAELANRLTGREARRRSLIRLFRR